MNEKEADAARVAEIRRLLAVVPEVVQGTWAWNEEAAAGLLLLPGLVAWLLADRERQAAEMERQVTAAQDYREAVLEAARVLQGQVPGRERDDPARRFWDLARGLQINPQALPARAETGEPE